MSRPVHVVVATDESYALPTAVTLRSLRLATPQAEVSVLHDAMPVDVRDRIEASLPPDGPALRWVVVDDRSLHDLPAAHLAAAAYFRLRVGDLIADTDRVLYLDVDVLVRKPLEPLFRTELGGAVVGAVRSMNFPYMGSGNAVQHWQALNLPPRAPYFNSGVLLIDLARWRAAKVAERVLELQRSQLADLTLADQTGLNVALVGRWHELDPMWNQQTPLLDPHKGAHLLYEDEVVQLARNDPAIVHFLDRPKPWHRESVHPWREEWRAVAAQTAFAPVRLQRYSGGKPLPWRVRRAVAALRRGI